MNPNSLPAYPFYRAARLQKVLAKKINTKKEEKGETFQHSKECKSKLLTQNN